MMRPMENRSAVVAALLAASLTSLAASARLYLWPDAPGPVLLSPPPPLAIPPTAPAATRSVEIRPGDNFAGALMSAGLRARMAAELATLFAKNGAELRKLRPGSRLEVTWNFRREPIEIRYAPSPWVRFAAAREDGSWGITRAETEPDVRVAAVHGEVKSSLFEAIDDVGESPQLVMALVNIFEWDFDFTADTRTGDRFRLLVEKRYAGDRFVNYGRIRVAQYVSNGRVISGVGFEAGGEGRYSFYDPEGRSLKKSFLKSPLEFSRITSRFTYARPHPILGGTLPHLAVDYAAPPGTPVRAVADGTVSHAGRAADASIRSVRSSSLATPSRAPSGRSSNATPAPSSSAWRPRPRSRASEGGVDAPRKFRPAHPGATIEPLDRKESPWSL